MRSGDNLRRDVIRGMRSSLHNAQIAKGGELTEEEELGVLAREARQRRESITEFDKGGRSDLVEKERGELDIIETYLPPAASREELRAAAEEVISEVGAKGPGDRGKVIPRLIAQFRGRAEGADVAAVVGELLTGGSS
jgi:uncharacterized protein YqeY